MMMNNPQPPTQCFGLSLSKFKMNMYDILHSVLPKQHFLLPCISNKTLIDMDPPKKQTIQKKPNKPKTVQLLSVLQIVDAIFTNSKHSLLCVCEIQLTQLALGWFISGKHVEIYVYYYNCVLLCCNIFAFYAFL